MFDELLGRDLGELEIEGFGDDGIESQRLERLHFLIKSLEQLEFRAPRQDSSRMRLERIENRLATECSRTTDDEIENRLMPTMHPIEIPDRQNGPIEFTRAI